MVPPNPDHDLLSVRYGMRSQRLRLELGSAPSWAAPDLDTPVERPSDAHAYYDQLLQDPPRDDLPYYVGPLPPSQLDSLFPSGITQLGLVPGVTTLYGHLGVKGSGTPFHCEDGNCRSYNLVFFGYKLWILINTKDTAIFEELVAGMDSCRGPRCDQFVRKSQVILAQEDLKAAKVRFEILIAGPGDMVVTYPRQYHLVINLTTSFAIATNFLLPGEVPIHPRTKLCPCCGFYPIPNIDCVKLGGEEGRARQKTRQKSRDARPRQVPATPALSMSETAGKRRATATMAQPTPKRPMNSLPDRDRICTMVERLGSRQAITRFQAMVGRWRQDDTPIRTLFNLPADAEGKARALWTLDSRLQARGILSQLYRIATQIKFVQQIDELTGKAGNNSTRTPQGAQEQILHILGLSSSQQYQQRMKPYRKWHQIFAPPYTGMLCFLPFGEEGFSEKEYSSMKISGEVDLFRAYLGRQASSTKLNTVGCVFLDCLWEGLDFPEYLWESRTGEELSKLRQPDLLRLLKPFETIQENVIPASDTHSPTKKSGLASVLRGAGCDICSATSCDCITQIFKSDFTPAVCGRKGRGLLAGRPGRGTVVFQKGDALGRLLGDIVPPGTYSDGWGFDVPSDFDGVPAVQIYPRDRGNIFRLVNHECGRNATAFVVCQTISGIYGPVFYAAKDLVDGDEITVNWGKNYLQGRQCFCTSCNGQ